jgi:hypothetical protein
MKKFRSFCLFTVMMLLFIHTEAQPPLPNNSLNFGLGVGIDYGGFGGRLTYLPVPYVAIFGAAGYNLLALGWNAGVQGIFLPYKKITPTLGAMYGYNGVIKIKGADEYNQTYYGPSVSAGMQINSKKRPGNYFNLELILPFRPQEFYDDMDVVKNDPRIEIYSEPLPVAFSIGYHFRL